MFDEIDGLIWKIVEEASDEFEELEHVLRGTIYIAAARLVRSLLHVVLLYYYS